MGGGKEEMFPVLLLLGILMPPQGISGRPDFKRKSSLQNQKFIGFRDSGILAVKVE